MPEKFNVYQMVTDKIVEALEAGVAPWKRSWARTQAGEYRNAVSGKHYRGINVLLLNVASAVNGWSDPRFLTYKNADALGGKVRKGEKATQVILWNFINKDDEVRPDGTVKKQVIPFIRYYNVFNVEQCEGLNIPSLVPEMPMLVDDVNEMAEKVLALANVRIGGDRACFVPNSDIVMMPPKSAFELPEMYYSVACHEMVHWSGHKSRLNRDLSGRFGNEAYAFEELVAEMGSAFVGSHVGIPFEGMQHPEYIATWVRKLKDDNRAIFTAASKAQIAADYLLEKAGIMKEEEVQEEAA